MTINEHAKTDMYMEHYITSHCLHEVSVGSSWKANQANLSEHSNTTSSKIFCMNQYLFFSFAENIKPQTDDTIRQ